MATTGAQAWNKHFRGRGDIHTVTKKETPFYDEDGKNIGKLPQNTPIIAFQTKEYMEKTPVGLANGMSVFVSFNNIQKPVSRPGAMLRVKPQDFNIIKTRTKWRADDLVNKICDEIEERQDIPAKTKNYLIAITKFYGKKDGVTAGDVREFYDNDIKGIPSIEKDYGEILGAIASVKTNILKNEGFRINNQSTIDIPLRGNEPLVDYYIITPNDKVAVSAKKASGASNTLAPGDIVKLIEKDSNLKRKWQNAPAYKAIEAIATSPIITMPFLFVNTIKPGTLTSQAINYAQRTFKAANMRSDKYDHKQFEKLFSFAGLPYNDQNVPTIGELFYYTEKQIIQTLNNQYGNDIDELFHDATSGQVVYVKFQITASAKEGIFKVEVPNSKQKSLKKVKLRTKNGTTRAADRVGIQT